MKFKLISISIFLLSGCQLTQEAEKISEYHPIQNSVHSFYNEQVMTLNTPNERLQVKSRNKSSSDVIMCVNKKTQGFCCLTIWLLLSLLMVKHGRSLDL